MKKLLPLWMFLAAWVPTLLTLLFYRLGDPGLMFIFMLAVPLLFAWYWIQTKGVGLPALLSANLAFSYAVASNVLTSLYYHHVSDDGMTLVVGELLTWAGTALIALIGICLIIARALQMHRAKRSQNN